MELMVPRELYILWTADIRMLLMFVGLTVVLPGYSSIRDMNFTNKRLQNLKYQKRYCIIAVAAWFAENAEMTENMTGHVIWNGGNHGTNV